MRVFVWRMCLLDGACTHEVWTCVSSLAGLVADVFLTCLDSAASWWNGTFLSCSQAIAMCMHVDFVVRCIRLVSKRETDGVVEGRPRNVAQGIPNPLPFAGKCSLTTPEMGKEKDTLSSSVVPLGRRNWKRMGSIVEGTEGRCMARILGRSNSALGCSILSPRSPRRFHRYLSSSQSRRWPPPSKLPPQSARSSESHEDAPVLPLRASCFLPLVGVTSLPSLPFYFSACVEDVFHWEWWDVVRRRSKATRPTPFDTTSLDVQASCITTSDVRLPFARVEERGTRQTHVGGRDVDVRVPGVRRKTGSR